NVPPLVSLPRPRSAVAPLQSLNRGPGVKRAATSMWGSMRRRRAGRAQGDGAGERVEVQAGGGAPRGGRQIGSIDLEAARAHHLADQAEVGDGRRVAVAEPAGLGVG